MPTTYAKIAYTYDANGQRASSSVTPPGGGGASVVNDYYQLGRLAYQTDGSGTLLARYTYDLTGAPVSVQVGSDPTTAPPAPPSPATPTLPGARSPAAARPSPTRAAG